VLRTLILATMLTTWGTTGAIACSCIMPTTEAALHRADAVFLGTIKHVSYSDPQDRGSKIIVEFEVTRVWKGPVTKKFEMHSIVERVFVKGFTKKTLWLEGNYWFSLIAVGQDLERPIPPASARIPAHPNAIATL
jgi:hypothetical protein